MQTAAVTIHSALIGSCRCSAMPPMAMPPPSANTTAETLRITLLPLLRSLLPSRAQFAQRLPVAGDQRVAVAMASTLHYPHAGAPHTIDQLAPAGEYPAVEDLIVVAREESRMLTVERDEVERCTRSQSARLRRHIGVQCLPAARECRGEQRAAGRGVRAG